MEILFYDSADKTLCENVLNKIKSDSVQKILIATGDSWTNRLKETFGHVDSSWVKKFIELTNYEYDLVIVAAYAGGSSTQTFINLIHLLSTDYIYSDVFFGGDNWIESYRFSDKQVDLIIQWTSIIRDYSEMNAWMSPYTFASLPDLSNNEFKKNMYDEYVTNVFNEKYFSYKVQLYSWQLQKYFEKWGINYYFWMGFCDLVPESVENTDMDIRKHLNKDRWFNLYDKPNNMSDYLYYLEKKELPNRLNPILTEGGDSGLKTTFSSVLKKLFDKNKEKSSLEYTYFLVDLHPSDVGNDEIAKILFKNFKQKVIY